ncbi:MAG TPA: hypothetical protein VK735_20765 [Pseudonocardia sp.]|uniref:hypothetical protein n=1 Tax=Pseudonocardia sp. TaxID=60912 RepID=UPI002CA2F64E|nr:hypothetical protein [Pseudonocardia sp.]HTF49881.1 hypothetical protein [Pseudonocardia sp.]
MSSDSSGGEPTIPETDTETWTSEECARAWGVKTPTWLGYVSRGLAPAPLPGTDERGRHRWDAEQVRSFPRAGVGRSRASTAPRAQGLLGEMADVADQIDHLRARQRELLVAGKAEGLEIRAMARALKISPQTAYGWLDR